MNFNSIRLWIRRLARLVLASHRTLMHVGWRSFFEKARRTLNQSRPQTTRPILKIRPRQFDQIQLANLSSGQQPNIDVILVTFNSEAVISACLRSIESSLYSKEKISIIVIDNNSTDHTRRILKAFQSKSANLSYIEWPANLGFGAAINVAFEKTTGKYTLILNPDVELEPFTIHDLVCAALVSESEQFAAWEVRQQPFEHPKLYDAVTLETEWISGACFLVLNTAFRTAGGFDGNIFLYGEDVDLSWRMRASGHKLRYVPKVVVKHKTYEDPDSIKPAQFYNSIVSNGILRLKHGSVLDIIAYGWRILAAFVMPPRMINIRCRLFLSLCSSLPKFFNAVSWRFSTQSSVPKSISRFSGWNYEIRRKGAFYASASRSRNLTVTIIIRTHQRPHFLREALQSVRNQTYKPHQVVVIEDGAPVSTAVIEEYSDLNIDYQATSDKVGRCRAGNIGLLLASGNFINFLDDDDLLFADHLETLVDALETNNSYKAAYSIAFEVKTHIISIQPFVYEEKAYHVVYEQPFDKNLLGKRNFIPINTMMFSRDLFVLNGGFNENLDVLEDWDLWRRYCEQTDFLFIEKLTCLYRVPFDSKVTLLRQRKFDEERQKMASLVRSGG